LFSPPKNDEEFGKWEKAIPKRDQKLNKTSRICARHFKPEEVLWYWTSGEGDSQIRVCCFCFSSSILIIKVSFSKLLYHKCDFCSKVRLQRPKLAAGAVPSIFPKCPPSCIPRIMKSRKAPKIRETLAHPEQRGQNDIAIQRTSTALSTVSIEETSRERHNSVDSCDDIAQSTSAYSTSTICNEEISLEPKRLLPSGNCYSCTCI